MESVLRASIVLISICSMGAFALTGCGSDSEPASTGTTSAATPSVDSTTTATATVPQTTTTNTTPSSTPSSGTTDTAPRSNSTGGEAAQGGGGDEQGIRVPATFVLRHGKLSPKTITVPAFLAVQLTIRTTGGARTIKLATPTSRRLRVPAHGRVSVRLAGLKPGTYKLSPGGGKLVVGGEPGP